MQQHSTGAPDVTLRELLTHTSGLQREVPGTAMTDVGTDFGLTRKAAMLNVLRWIPRNISFTFLAVQSQSGGFHAKIVAWKAHSGKYYCMIGSSNLSKAAFSNNCEANVMTEISSRDFARLSAWLDSVSTESSPISKDWIKHHYTEAKVAHKGKKAEKNAFQIKPSDLPHGAACARAVRDNRRKQASFHEIAKPIRAAAVRCTRGKISRSQFWQTFWKLWGAHKSRLQGSLGHSCKVIMIIFVLASLTEFEHGIIREARVPVPVGRNAHSIWAAEQIVIMMSSSRTGKTEGPQRIGFQGDIRRRDAEA